MKVLLTILLLITCNWSIAQQTETEVIQQRIGETLLLPTPKDTINAQTKSKWNIKDIEIKVNNWKKDSLGCSGLRNDLFFEFWQNLHHYIENDTSLVLILLGAPNETKYFKNKVSYIYYYGTNCIDGIIDSRLAPNLIVFDYTLNNEFIKIGNITH